jgi:hypothetical protein
MKADPRTPPEFAHLPKWLVASADGTCGAERGYVIHCHFPRFLMAVDLESGSGLPLWIDKPKSAGGAEHASPQDTALVLEATDFYRATVSRRR